MAEAGQLAQTLSAQSKRLHRRFDGRPELRQIEQWTNQISQTLDGLHGEFRHVRVKMSDPRPEVPEQDDPTPVPEQLPDEQRRQLTEDEIQKAEEELERRRQEEEEQRKIRETEEEREDKDPEPKEGGEATGLLSLDAQLQAAGEEPLPPPLSEPTADLGPPKRALADLSYDELKELARQHGVTAYRTKRENIEKGLVRKGITEG